MKNNTPRNIAATGLLISLATALPCLAASPQSVGQQIDNIWHASQEMSHQQLPAILVPVPVMPVPAHHPHHHGSPITSPACLQEGGLRSIQGNAHTQIQFINTSRQEIRAYWLDYNGRRVFYRAIPPGGQYSQPTFRTHPWVLTNAYDQCQDLVVSQQASMVYNIR